jgi:hypothetical protein
MNKQPTTIKTYLLRGAFFLSLGFVIVLPLALGQRQPLAPGQRQSADTILQHFQPQAPQQAPLIVPMPPAGVIDCDNEPGIIIHDDGGIENGYSGNPFVVSEVRFADKFTPSSYPASFTSVCLDFVILSGGPATYPIDVVVYDDDGPGGAPGTLLGELNGQTATTHLFTGGGQAPVWNSYDISSMGLNITSGSVYIGTRYVPPSNNVFTSADESGPVGFAGGYWWNNFDGVWSPTQNAFAFYTSMFIRAVESVGGTPTPTPTPGRIVLRANTDRLNRSLVVHLAWTGATTASVKIFRNQVLIARVENTGSYSDTLTVHDIYTYQVCEARTGNCSNEVHVRFGGP